VQARVGRTSATRSVDTTNIVAASDMRRLATSLTPCQGLVKSGDDEANPEPETMIATFSPKLALR
jgi:hypothetical protein